MKRAKSPVVWTADRMAVIYRMKREGMSHQQIAKLVKCSPQNIDRIVRLHPPETIAPAPSRKPWKEAVYAMTEALLYGAAQEEGR